MLRSMSLVLRTLLLLIHLLVRLILLIVHGTWSAAVHTH